MVLTSISSTIPNTLTPLDLTIESDPMAEALAGFRQMSTQEQLAYLKAVYGRMGQSFSDNISGARWSETAHRLCQTVIQVGATEQLQVVGDILRGADTRFSVAYKALTPNTRLAFWHRLLRHKPPTTTSITFQPPMPTVQKLLLITETMNAEQQVEFLKQALTPPEN